jgi:hypothetical protein
MEVDPAAQLRCGWPLPGSSQGADLAGRDAEPFCEAFDREQLSAFRLHWRFRWSLLGSCRNAAYFVRDVMENVEHTGESVKNLPLPRFIVSSLFVQGA